VVIGSDLTNKPIVDFAMLVFLPASYL